MAAEKNMLLGLGRSFELKGGTDLRSNTEIAGEAFWEETCA